MRSSTPPPAPTSEYSSPAYHSSPGESVDTLSDSWIPIADPEPASPAHSSDNDTLSTLGSGSLDDDDDTAGYLTDSSASEDHDRIDNLLDGEYTDAESPATDLRGSSSTLGRGEESLHSSLIYPYADTGDSFTTTTSDSTTPNASVGALPSVGEAQRVPRMSAYRLGKLGREKQETGSRDQAGSRGSLWSPGPDAEQAINVAGLDHLLNEPFGDMGQNVTTVGTPEKQDSSIPTAQDIREGVKNDRLTRALANAKAAGMRVGTQKWSLKMSLFTLASLLGVVLATARYSTVTPAKSASTPEPVPAPAPTGRSFAILDYFSAPSLPASSIFDSAPSSIMPDVRLIKHALSLSTKAVPLAPAEVKNTKRDRLSAPKSIPGKTKSASSGSTSNALSVRATEAGLTTFFDGSAAWQKTIRGFVRPSAPSTPPANATETECECGYGQMIVADLTAWTRALSRFSHADLIHFIRDQVLETIKQEFREAIAIAAQIVELSKNATRVASQHVQYTADRTTKRALAMYDNVRSYGKSINMTASTQKAYDAAHAARSGLDRVSSQAAMTSLKGKEAIYKARAGLEYLVAEAKRMKGDGGKIKPAVPPPSSKRNRKGKGVSVRERFRAHRAKGRKVNDEHKKPITSKAKPKANAKSTTAAESTLKQRFLSALHNAAMPFVLL